MNNVSLNDTLDQFTLSSGKLIHTIENQSQIDEGNKHLKISVDDSMFLNDSFNVEEIQDLSRIIKETSVNLHSKYSNKVDRSNPITNEIKNNSSILNANEFNSTCGDTICQSLNETSDPFSKTNVTSINERNHNPDRSLPNKNLNLSILGLPQQILLKYESRNIISMLPWQLECLSSKGVLENGKNLIYSAPTSAGKTLVSEIIAIKTILEHNKKDIFGTSGIRVEGFMGGYNPPGGFKSVNFAICTIEKANALINRLLEERKLHEVGAIIVDELHLLGDSSRGYLLELLLTKVKYACSKYKETCIQIVGMSATLPNLNLLGEWIEASVYETNFRPIPLNEQCLIDDEIFDSDINLVRKLKPLPDLDTDTDSILQLCLETILLSCSVLIFCPTKNWCENLAVQIAAAFYKLGISKSELGIHLRSQILAEPIRECLEQLKRSPSGLDDVLHKTVSFGVAFHHAGLTFDERDIIENGFRSGSLRVLVATSTLSSGVNLPARRVLIRTPMFFGKPLNILSYKQMAGRAGRMGKDTEGESILICNKNQISIARELISIKLNPITSCLESSGRLKRALLEIVASEIATTPDEIEMFGKCTLFSTEGADVHSPIVDALDFLMKYQFIRLQVSGEIERYVATSLAKACLNSALPPEEGLLLFAELEKARQCFVLETELHLIYLVTPYSAQISTINWMQYLDLWEMLPASMKRVGELVGVKVSFIVNCSRGKMPDSSDKLAIHRRFYTALALQDLVNEVSVNDVAKKYGCNRGHLQSLQLNAATFAGMVTAFSKQLGWSSVEILIGQFQDRLQFGVSRDLLDLMRLPILNGLRARVLFNNGVQSLIDLAACNPADLENILHRAIPFESKIKEGETKHNAEKRQQLRTIFITGKSSLTESEAAILMISEARKFLKHEIGLQNAQWLQHSDKQVMDNIKKSNSRNSEFSVNVESPRNESKNSNNICSPNNLSTLHCPISEDVNNDVVENAIHSSLESLFNDSVNTELLNIKYTVEKEAVPLSPNDLLNSFNKNLSFAENTQLYSPKKKTLSTKNLNKNNLEIINICNSIPLYEAFITELVKQSSISIALCTVLHAAEKQIIGIRTEPVKDNHEFTYKKKKLIGIAIYWPQETDHNVTYYIELVNLLQLFNNNNERLKDLASIVLQKTLKIFNAKDNLKVLHQCLHWDIDSVILEDSKIGDWLLNPESIEKGLINMAKVYSRDQNNLLSLFNKEKSKTQRTMHNTMYHEFKISACLEALINWNLCENIIKHLTNQDPKFLTNYANEMKIITILAKMELTGFPVNLQILQSYADSLKCHMQSIEREAYNIAGRRFSFTSSAAVSKVLNMNKVCGKKNLCTNKNALMEKDNPLAELIIQWRKISHILTIIVYPLLRNVENGRIYGNCITHTSTGRVSMHDPNLQNVPRDFQFLDPCTKIIHEICIRNAFSVAVDNTAKISKFVIVSADYCQLELRLLAHLSQDSALCRIMCSDGDIFKNIAADWMRIDEAHIDFTLRQRAKQVCYGIIYGIGNKALAAQMNITEAEAIALTESFHERFPTIRSFIRTIIEKCREMSYVETFLGRRRYLPNINSTNLAERSKAERQAVNTSVQGSAADIVKQAMILVEKKLQSKFRNSRNVPKLILQLHDELLYEVPVKYEDIFCRILRKCMEDCVQLRIPLPVKVQSGKSWGNLSIIE